MPSVLPKRVFTGVKGRVQGRRKTGQAIQFGGGGVGHALGGWAVNHSDRGAPQTGV